MMKPRSKHYFTRLHSYADAVATVEALKARGFNVRAFGRMRDKRKIFGANGQEYLIMNCNFKNDVKLNSPIAQYAYAWAIYVYPKKVRVKKTKPTIELDTLQIEIDKVQPLVDYLVARVPKVVPVPTKEPLTPEEIERVFA